MVRIRFMEFYPCSYAFGSLRHSGGWPPSVVQTIIEWVKLVNFITRFCRTYRSILGINFFLVEISEPLNLAKEQLVIEISCISVEL